MSGLLAEIRWSVIIIIIIDVVVIIIIIISNNYYIKKIFPFILYFISYI